MVLRPTVIVTVITLTPVVIDSVEHPLGPHAVETMVVVDSAVETVVVKLGEPSLKTELEPVDVGSSVTIVSTLVIGP